VAGVQVDFVGTDAGQMIGIGHQGLALDSVNLVVMNANGVDPRDVAAMLSKMVIHELADLGVPKSAISLRRSCRSSHCE
jgi:hypothetical protein